MRTLRGNGATRSRLSCCGTAGNLGRRIPMATNGTNRLRMVIVDGDEAMRRRLRALLESIEPVDILGEASTAPQAARSIEALRPELVLLDVDLQGVAGIDALRTADAPCLGRDDGAPGARAPGLRAGGRRLPRQARAARAPRDEPRAGEAPAGGAAHRRARARDRRHGGCISRASFRWPRKPALAFRTR